MHQQQKSHALIMLCTLVLWKRNVFNKRPKRVVQMSRQ